jgi:RNA polymerase sigma-70 factor (ECF subfamily)
MRSDFRELVEEHGSAIYTFALYLLRHREDAEDVAQEVLVRLWKHRQRIDPPRVRAWVLRVTRNLVIDVVRRRRVHAAQADGVVAETAAAWLAASAPAAEAETSPALRAALESAIAALEEPYRSLLVVREIQGFSYEQIAEAFGMPLGTVKAYLHRARRRVREELLREWKDDD